MANAAVTVTNVNTNASEKVLTGPDGNFAVAGLPPGTYRVDVETAGFKRTSQQNIELTSTGPTTVNITLQAGNINETVEIKASSPAVESHGGELSMALNTRAVRELPQIDRNWQQLTGLMTGVTPPHPALPFVLDPARNRFYSTNGQFPYLNAYFFEGLANWEPFRATAIRIQPDESVQQLSIVTGNYVPSKGYVTGALDDTITRGGTANWHGSLFEFWSGNVLRSRNFFNPTGTVPRFVYNQMGATVGGAIVPNKTFLFGSYQGTFENGSIGQITTVPTAAAVSGNFSGIPGLTLTNPAGTPLSGNTIPSNLINPTSAAIAGYIPAPNRPGLVNNFYATNPFRNDVSKVDARIDQHFTDKTAAFARYGYSNYYTNQESPLGNVIGASLRDRLVAQNAALDFTHAFGASFLGDLRLGYNRYYQNLRPYGSQAPLGAALGVDLTGNNLIGVNIPGMPLIGQPGYVPQNPIENNGDGILSFAKTTGHHDIKFGVSVLRFQANGFQEPTFPGEFYGPNGTAYFGPGATLPTGAALGANSQLYNSFAAFLMGAPSQVGVTSFLRNPTIRQTDYAGWVGDTMHLFPHFTLDLGLRYDVFSPLRPAHTGGAQFYNLADNTFNYANVGGTPWHYQDYDTDNWAPRIGLAYRPFSRTVIRGGYAIQYFQNPYQYSGFMAPMTGSVAGVLGTYGVAPVSGTFGPIVSSTTPGVSSLTNGASAGNLPVAIVPKHFDTPYVQTFSLQVQQDFYWTTVLTAGYVGTLDRHLVGIENLNAAAPGTGLAGLPYYASFGRTAPTLFYQNGLTSNYNSLQASLSKRFSHGISFLASYTWSHALGYTTPDQLLLTPNDLSQSYGNMSYDRRQVLNISHLFELPWGKKSGSLLADLVGGWQLNGIFTWSTGAPLTITADPVTCNCPGQVVLANYTGAPTTVSNSANPYAILNPAAFTAPPAGQAFGNLTRGAIRAPGYRTYNLSLFKTFHVMDHYIFELRGAAYNLTNTPHFLSPITNINSPGFGEATTTLYGGGDNTVNGAFGRQVNVGLRVLF